MKGIGSKTNIKIKRFYLRGFATVLILLGLSVTAFYSYKFIRGNLAIREYKQIGLSDKSNPSVQEDMDNITNVVDNEENPLYLSRPESGDKIGDLYLDKLDISLPIYEGTNDEELDKGVGHYENSVLPGEKDNSVLSGHRDTVFRKLGDIGIGDTLTVHTSAGEFVYKVYKVRIVDKNDRTVIVPKPRATLTVSTCYPFSYIGAAPKRYVLVAKLVKQTISKK